MSQLTHIDDTDVHPEGFAREVRDVPHVVAEVSERCDPMEYRRPYPRPRHHLWVQSNVVVTDDVIYCVVEERDKSSDANDSQRLTGKDTEDHGGKRR